MTILGIGVDILHLPRLTRHLSDNRLAKRILSPVEFGEYLALPQEEHGRRIRFLGVRCACSFRFRVQSSDTPQMGSKGSRIQGGISNLKTNLARFYAAEASWQSQARPGLPPQGQPALTQTRSNTYVCEP